MGIYRVKASYYKDPQLSPGAVSEKTVEEVMYSNEFTIKESEKLSCDDLKYDIFKNINNFNFCQTKDDYAIVEKNK